MVVKLVKTDRMEIDGRACDLRYYERRTLRGGCRYSCEVLLGDSDRIIVDDDSLPGLESRVRHLVPATIYSRSRPA
jgi:hypothetical protein